MDGLTTCSKAMITTGRDGRSASWINICSTSFFTDASISRDLEADRTSNSSWSLMSGNGQNDLNSRSTPIPTPNSNTTSTTPNTESLPADSPVQSPVEPISVRAVDNNDNSVLLNKISSLQEERMMFVEKINLLEHSSSGMADELLKKSALINYYCMQGGKAGKSKIKEQSLNSLDLLASYQIILERSLLQYRFLPSVHDQHRLLPKT